MKRSIKDAAKKGQKDVCIILAKEMIHSKKAVSKLYASKAQMNSVLLSMKNQLCESGFRLTYAMQSSITTPSHFIDRSLCVCVLIAVLRMAGALQKSTEVMKAMQSLVKIPEIQATMRELSKEMMKVWKLTRNSIT